MNELSLAGGKSLRLMKSIPQYKIEDHNTLAHPGLRWIGPILTESVKSPPKFSDTIFKAKNKQFSTSFLESHQN